MRKGPKAFTWLPQRHSAPPFINYVALISNFSLSLSFFICESGIIIPNPQTEREFSEKADFPMLDFVLHKWQDRFKLAELE